MPRGVYPRKPRHPRPTQCVAFTVVGARCAKPPYHEHDLCWSHLAQQFISGTSPERVPSKPCEARTVDGYLCNGWAWVSVKDAYARGLCAFHARARGIGIEVGPQEVPPSIGTGWYGQEHEAR